MVWIGSVHCEKFGCDFMARSCALIAPVQPILHRVSCSNETLPNAPKYYEMHQNMIIGSNWVDRVRSLRKIRTWLRGMNFCINCTSSHHFAPSFMQLWNHKKCTQTLWNLENMSLGSNGVDWVRSLRKILMRHQGMNFCINSTCSTHLHRVSCSNKTLPNATKHYETHTNMSLVSNGVGRVH